MAIINGRDNRDDTLVDTADDDQVSGFGGNDSLKVTGGRDTADGGAGIDTLIIDYSGVLNDVVTNNAPVGSGSGFGGFDGSFYCYNGWQVSYGSIDKFDITSGAGNDSITTASGDDVVKTGAGNDTVNVGSGKDSADGGADIDIISADLSAMTTAIIWNLQSNSFTGLQRSFKNFEEFGTVSGGSAADTLVSGSGAYNETINGNGGDDTITVLGGTDTVNGGAGSDTLVIDYGSVVNDVVTNNGPGASATGFGGYDGSYYCYNGWSVSYSSIENFTITTGSGNDSIVTANGNDTVKGGDGNDLVNVGSGTDTADGEAGSDTISTNFSGLNTAIAWNLQTNSFTGQGSFKNFEAFGTVSGGKLADTFVSGAGGAGETINGNEGDDSITVFGGADAVNGGAGSDTLVIDYGLYANDIITNAAPVASGTGFGGFDGAYYCYNGFSVSYSSIDRFSITAGSGNDSITTATGDDIVNGGAGNDTINVGTGKDSADGGTDYDLISTDLSAVTTAITWNLQTDAFSGAGAGRSFKNFEAFGTLATGSGNDTVVSGRGGAGESITTGAGNDKVTVFDGSDSVVLGTGSDTLVVDYSTATSSVVNNSGPSANGADGEFDGSFYNYTNGASVGYSSVGAFVIITGSGNDTITTASGDDVVTLGAGADGVNVGTGADTADGGGGIDGISADLRDATGAIVWNLATNVFSGGPDSFTNFEYFGTIATASGNDVITTGATGANEAVDTGSGSDAFTTVNGNDGYTAGAGADTLIVDYGAATSSVVTNGGPTANGTDGEFDGSYYNYTNGASIGYSSVGTFVIATGSGNDTITTATGDDIVRTGAGTDSVNAGAGNDLVEGGNDNDVLDGGDDIDTVSYAGAIDGVTVNLSLTGQQNTNTAGVDTLFNFENVIGSSGNGDRLTGTDGANVIDGGAGDDLMYGGNGDDTYIVDASDFIRELPGGGIDLVRASVSYVLGDELENLTLTGSLAIDGTGNAVANLITGNDAANTLDGMAGADTLTGLGGNDTYVVDDAGDTVIEAAAGGTDVVRARVSYTLAANLENLTLTGATAIDATGNDLANTITGNGAANTLDGKAGADTMAGLGGNDSYVVDDAGDVVIEAANGGVDLVRSSLSYTLGANLETLVLTGVAAIDGTGNALANVLTGNDAANLLDGGAGADAMSGGGGNDSYVVDDAGDTVTEAANGGADLVRSSASFTLGANVENLTLTGTGNISGTGNDAANVVTGNGGNNGIDGGAGNDTLDGGGGTDTASYASATSAVTVSLAILAAQQTGGAGQDTLASFENLTGSAFADRLTGDAGANTLNGGGSDDVLVGSGGSDRLSGGNGTDTIVLTGGFADYSIAVASGVYTFTDLRAASPDGVDKVDGVERVTLASGSYAIDDVVNRGPTANADTADGVVEAGAGGGGVPTASGNVLANDTDPNLLTAGLGERLSVTGARAGTGGGFTSIAGATVVNGVYGTLTIDADGSYSYALDDSRPATDRLTAGQAAQDVFSYAITDLHGAVSQATLTVKVTGTDDTSAGNDTLQVTTGRASSLDPAVFLANDHGAIGETLSVVSVSNVQDGTVALVDGRLVITAARPGAGGFDYVVQTAGGGSATGHVDFTAIAATRQIDATAPDGVTAVDYVGGSKADTLTGSGGDDRLVGNAGKDLLDGGAGADRMEGGSGSDTYHVDTAGDQVIEAAAPGTDTVVTTLAAYTLGDDVETLTFAGAGDFAGTGNALKNTIAGGVGNDTLSGVGGTDTLIGGAGDDRLDGGVGADTASYLGAAGGVTVDLRIAGAQDTIGAGRDTLVSIENLTGSTGTDTLNGTDNANVIDGGANKDVLFGNGGNDQLAGGTASDTVTGGGGADAFVFRGLAEIAAGDRITDFSHAQGDTIDFSKLDADLTLAGRQSFTFIGTSAFTGASGSDYELRYAASTGDDLIVQGDINHDGAADFSFIVHATALQASDFVLI